MNELIHQNTGLILFRVNSLLGGRGKGRGTGLLISPNLVLTAAHIIYNQKNKEEHQDFVFYPGQSGPIGEGYRVESYFFPSTYKTDQSPTNDYALLKLSRRVNREEFIPLCGNVQKLKRNQYSAKLALFGYPSG